jgi:hypothetical protein
MSTPSLASADRRDVAQQSAGGSVVCLDFQSVAGLIDAVAGAEPVRLETLLGIIHETSYRMEARIVLQAAVACRDPLAHPGSICKDALQTIADLEKLARARHWPSLERVVGRFDPRACALLNACDHELARLTGPKQERLKAIRPRLEQAAALETTRQGAEMRAIAALRHARCRNIWQLYEHWRDRMNTS